MAHLLVIETHYQTSHIGGLCGTALMELNQCTVLSLSIPKQSRGGHGLLPDRLR